MIELSQTRLPQANQPSLSNSDGSEVFAVECLTSTQYSSKRHRTLISSNEVFKRDKDFPLAAAWQGGAVGHAGDWLVEQAGDWLGWAGSWAGWL
ncbi:hypothetical protein BY996DRAFT_6437113 [Phakopsora pachyrhizi]|nr:hypothetical protein BY996DRAFT_6437113 [Phakopsora pachyrhizi]